MTSGKRSAARAILVGLMMATAVQASFVPATFQGGSGNLSASAEFDVQGNNLIVTLANTSTHDVLVPSDVLTGVFFDLNPQVRLTPLSAVLGQGSSVVYGGTTDLGNVVGGEWAYKDALSGAPGGARMGISSSGLGLFGPGNLFPGHNLAGPASADGLQYGITSPGDVLSTGNIGVKKEPLIQGSVIFTLGLQDDIDLYVSNVRFQYGTSLLEENFSGTEQTVSTAAAVPETSTFLAGALVLLPLAASVIRRRD